MTKRKLEDVDYNDDDDGDNDDDNDNDNEELKAVFVDTNLDTHLVVLVSPLFSFSHLKESIVMEHSKCFPDFGEIKIRALKVKREQNYYHLSERMLLRTAFHGAEGWFVFADVDGNPFSRPPNAQSISDKQLQLNHSNHFPVSNLQIPKNPSEKFDSKSAQRELNSSCPEATNCPKKKKKKRKSEATEHKDFASGFSVENMHKIESNNSIKQPLLESKGVISGVEGGASKPKFLASKEDDLQQNGVAASIVLPSKVAETSTSGQVRKKEGKHVHDSSSVSTDAAVETNIDTAKGTSQLMGQLEGSGKILGSTLNQESVIHSFEAKSEPRAKKTKKTKKSGCDGVDRRYAVNLGKGPGDEKLFLQKESDNSAEGTLLKPTGNSELLVSQHKALYSGEKTGAEEEDVPSFKSSEFNKTTESDNTSKTRKTSKAMSSVTDKQNLSGIKENSDLESADTRQKGTTTGETLNKVSGFQARKNKKANTKDVGVNKSLAAQLGQVPNIDQYDVTVSDSEKVICEIESNSKITVEEEIMESGAIPKKKKTSRTKTSVKAKNDLSIPSHINDQELTDSREEAAEMLQPTDTNIELRVGSVSNKKTHTEDSSGLPSKDLSSETMKDMASSKIVTDDCLRDNGTHDLADQHQMYHDEVNDNSARLVSADVAEETKAIMSKRSKQKKKKSKENVRTSQALPMIMIDNQEAAGTELLAESSKHEGNSELKSSRENGTHDISYQSRVHYEELNDMSACLVFANVAEGAMMDKPKEKKQKTKRSRENECPSQVLPKIMNNDLEATDSGLLQPSKCSKSEENSELKSVNPKKRSKSRQTTSSVGVADILLTDDCLRENETHDSADQSQVYNEVLNDIPAGLVSANVAEGTVVDKSNARKKKTKKSIGNEKTSQVLPQIMNDELEAASTGLWQPSKSSNPEEDSELRSVSKKKRSKSRQTVSSAGVSEIHVTELVTEGKKVDDDILTNSGMRGNKDQNALGNGEREHSNEISVQKVSAHEANVGNLEKRTTSKSKRKKLDQHSSVDTSSNLITSEKGYESERKTLVKEVDPSSNLLKELQSDFHEEEQMGAAGVEVFQPSQVSNCEANEEITSDKPEQRVQVKRPASGQQSDVKTQRTVEEQADDGMANRIAYDAEKQEEVSLHEKCHDGSSDVKLDDQQTRKLKGKKLDLSSSVDTSPGHNLITSKKGKESERNVQVFSELQNDIQESETLSQIASKPLQLHQASQHEEHLEVQNLQVNKTMQKAAFSANILPEVEHSGVLLTNDNVDADKQTNGLGVAEIRPEKSSVCKMKVKNLDLPTSVEIKPKGVNNTLSTKEIECEKNSPDLGQLQKSITKIDHGRKPHSIKNDSASFKKVVDTQVSVGDPFNARSEVLGQNIHVRKSGVKGPNMDNGSRCSGTSSLMSGKLAEKTHAGKNMETQKKNNEGHIYKTPSNKIMGAPVNSLPQKRHLPPTSGGLFGDISSDSSDGEVERSGSSSSTRTPEDLSSSDYSEGENVGDVATSQHESKGSRSARDKANLNLTALKDLDLSTVIRSSSRYKKAKLAASQSQMEDGESELPEFVPDSLPVTDL